MTARRTFLTAAIVLAMTACSDSTGPESIDIRGDWSGSVALPNGFSSSADFQQSGNGVSGTMTISGSFVNRPVTGQIDPSERTLEWSVFVDCEEWTGTLGINAAETEMAGTVRRDGSGCVPEVSNVNGTMQLTR
ncbi:MAG: hypothetical protein WD960_06825 [Gemmatimonadota bacterium]